MNIQIIKASAGDKLVISNLMQFYMYDFSEYTGTDVEPDGLFGGYPFLEDYWKEGSHKFPYVIKKGEKYIGFVFVRILEAGEMKYFSIAEFFIMRKYRRKGFGARAAEQVFNLHRGLWEVYQMEANRTAQVFWRKVILEYTRGQFGEKTENGRTIQSFSN